jgi:hypothetical protein
MLFIFGIAFCDLVLHTENLAIICIVGFAFSFYGTLLTMRAIDGFRRMGGDKSLDYFP